MAAKENKIVKRRMAGAWVSAVISVSLVLLLVGVAAMLLVNSERISGYFKENLKLSVMMKTEVGEDEALGVQDRIEALPFVRSTEFISREQGQAEMAQMLGADFLRVFETSPIPISIDVTLDPAYVVEDSLAVVRQAIMENSQVEEISYQQSLVDALNANLRRISVVLGIFIALLLFISFVLINNTIRLWVYDRRFNIHTMKLVGATRSFIRAPFLWRSTILGLFSSLIAILILVGLLFVVRNEFAMLFEVFTKDLMLIVMGVVLLSGELICIVSTYFTVNKLVSLSKDELYY